MSMGTLRDAGGCWLGWPAGSSRGPPAGQLCPSGLTVDANAGVRTGARSLSCLGCLPCALDWLPGLCRLRVGWMDGWMAQRMNGRMAGTSGLLLHGGGADRRRQKPHSPVWEAPITTKLQPRLAGRFRGLLKRQVRENCVTALLGKAGRSSQRSIVEQQFTIRCRDSFVRRLSVADLWPLMCSSLHLPALRRRRGCYRGSILCP